MRQNISRKELIQLSTRLFAAFAMEGAIPRAACAQTLPGHTDPLPTANPSDAQNAWALGWLSNFKAIYGDPQTKAAFLLFLTNVYRLFPEDRFHKLIEESSQTEVSDKAIYAQVQRRINEINPILGDVRYALPALARQKTEMARETMELLGSARTIDGYLEIGTTGRYISKLKYSVKLSGDIILLHTDAQTYSPTDIVERAQLRKLGRYVSLNGYAPVASSQVADSSIDLITNFIGFHHCPVENRDGFVASLHRVLRRGGRMIVRDHDVSSEQMNRMAALAHDVFNMGLGARWSANQTEIRNFTSLTQLADYIEAFGFKRTGKTLLQPGDPTKNTLMEFVRL